AGDVARVALGVLIAVLALEIAGDTERPKFDSHWAARPSTLVLLRARRRPAAASGGTLTDHVDPDNGCETFRRSDPGSALLSDVTPPVSDVVVHVELPRVRAEPELVDLVLPLVGGPRVDHALDDHAPGDQELVR